MIIVFVLMVIKEKIVKKNYNATKIAKQMVFVFMDYVIVNKAIQDKTVRQK